MKLTVIKKVFASEGVINCASDEPILLFMGARMWRCGNNAAKTRQP
jgi:hypothetical protein